MTNREIRAYLASYDLRAVRKACGIRLIDVASVVGARGPEVANWEARRRVPSGPEGARYVRVVAGMVRHLEVARDDEEAAA